MSFFVRGDAKISNIESGKAGSFKWCGVVDTWPVNFLVSIKIKKRIHDMEEMQLRL